MVNAKELPAKALLLYILAEYEYEMELEHRADYNTKMLYYTAQPTRENPERLPVYKPLKDSIIKRRKKEMTSEEILAGLIGNMKQEE